MGIEPPQAGKPPGPPGRWSDRGGGVRAWATETLERVAGDRTRRPLLAALTDPRTGERGVQKLIQNAIVLEVTSQPAPAPAPILVQLLVTPDEAQSLLTVQEAGRFSLSLRSPDDLEPALDLERTTVRTLLDGRPGSRCCCKRSIEVIRAAPK